MRKDTTELICLLRSQVVVDVDYCCRCWEDDDLWNYGRSHLSMDECMGENLVTEEEFDEIKNKRYMQSVTSGTDYLVTRQRDFVDA